MHFYCFLPFYQRISLISRIFLYILNRRQRRRTRKLYMIVAVVSSYFCAFCVFLWLIYKHRMSRIFYVLNRRQRRRTRKLYVIVGDVISYFCAFCVFCGWFSSPIQELGPGATPCRGGRCAAHYPHGPQQQETKILRLWLVFPPMELNHRKGHAGRRMW